MTDNIFRQPEQTDPYKIDCKNIGYTNYSLEECVIGISMGKNYHKDEKLQSLINWALNRYKTVHILVADTLQRHNIKFSKKVSMDEARLIAKKQGDDWLAENQEYLDDTHVIRWDDLLNLDEVKLYNKLLTSKYNATPEIRYNIDSTIKKAHFRFYKKDSKLFSITNFQEFYRQSKTYLLEEGAICSYIENHMVGPVIYPGNMSFEYIVEPDGSVRRDRRFISVSLYKNKSFKKAA
ncbi:MAG: hypothetical protein CMP22_06255 [Rickettsiales bacterium]|nr:hypothetical protein [Rickettsiales bacterium]|tara:strand:- start:376 stop:1083 length:708 start_codon:yes stop_codon:yes gene_type:complete